ncbi:hypothetical protein BJX76DRAFT_363397 [Aspergillus varians]
MVCIKIEGLRKQGSSELESATLDLPAETELANIAPLLPGFVAPDSFTRNRLNGTRGHPLEPDSLYVRKCSSEKLEVSADRPSSFSERRINIDDTFLYFAGLEKGSKGLSARLDNDGTGQSQAIIVDDGLRLAFHRTLRMPDDGKIHPLPASHGLFPLYNVEAFSSQLPEHITKRGGVFFPMWQREALWIEFKNQKPDTRYAVRVNIGHINAISGLDIYEVAGKQDYVVVPGQEWLDGIAVAPGVVRQFVAMPLGSGYTVEGQVSGAESFGGIQIEVIPSYDEARCTFTRSVVQGPDLPMAEHETPGDYQLKSGDIVTMTPFPSPPRGRARLCDFLDDGEGFEGIEMLHLKVCCRSTGEMPPTADNQMLQITYGDPWVDPLLGGSQIPYVGRERYSCEQGSVTALAQDNPQTEVSHEEMGIAAGGKLLQDIVEDVSHKRIWDTSRAKSLDIHILHPPDFEAVTHILPPKTPITMEEYLAAGIHFFVIEEDPDQRLDGSAALAGVKSISTMDEHIGVHDNLSTEFDPLKPKRCGTCAVRLCDCIVRPCNHQFCHVCIKAVASPSTDTSPNRDGRRCPLCSTSVQHVAGFSAPMNLPGEETFKVDVPVVMLEVQDGRTAFESIVKMRL